jgi:hypothetical protein
LLFAIVELHQLQGNSSISLFYLQAIDEAQQLQTAKIIVNASNTFEVNHEQLNFLQKINFFLLFFFLS